MLFIKLAIIFLFSGFALVSHGETEQSSLKDEFIEEALKDNNFVGLNKEEFSLSIDCYNKGVDLLQNGKNQESIKSFDDAIKIVPGFVLAYDNKVLALERMNRFEEAIHSFDNAIRYNP